MVRSPGNWFLPICSDPSADDGAVYVFAGGDVSPADVQGTSSDPIATSLVSVEDGVYRYEIGFLPQNTYTIAYTCDASADEPATGESLAFVGVTNVVVNASSETTHDFPADAVLFVE